MADIYCDMSLGSGANDGTSWTDAYQSIATALNASNVAPGDNLWLKGSETAGGTFTLDASADDPGNPVKIYGCKSATTATPPAQSDLIPGWYTGEARTLANRAYKDADCPALTMGSNTLNIRGPLQFYGLIIIGSGNWIFGSNLSAETYEEVLFDTTGASNLSVGTNVNSWTRFINCGYETNNTGQKIQPQLGRSEWFGLEYIGSTVATTLLGGLMHGHHDFIGCDLSAMSGNLITVGSFLPTGEIVFRNCSLHASTTFTTGTPTGTRFRVEAHGCNSDTGVSSGTIQDVDISTHNGDITLETTAVRTGGADDGGDGAWALAFTPRANDTREVHAGLEGPWMAFKLSGDGTAQTVSVSIANSGAADYNDDDVWLEVVSPSEGGSAQYDFQPTRMYLLGTPTAVTDDTGSTWGTGANNHQTLSVSISPDYVGRAYCRVVFAKNFSSSPETLYVDPLPVVS